MQKTGSGKSASAKPTGIQRHTSGSLASESSASGEHFTKHLHLVPLETPQDVKQFLRDIHKTFVASVEPVESGLQDFLIQNHVLTETDNESLMGQHHPLCGDKARHLFKLLYPIDHVIFLRDVLPVLCHKYDYIIPARFWKVDVSRTTSEHVQAGEREGMEGAASPGEFSPMPGSSREGNGDVCGRCMIRRRVRSTGVADFLFQKWAVTFTMYCDLTQDRYLSAEGWQTLFSSFKSLPKEDQHVHEEELMALLRKHSLPVPRDLGHQMREGFPCHRGVHCASITKNQRDKWCESYKRWTELRAVQASSDISSDTLYPSTESSINSSSSSSRPSVGTASFLHHSEPQSTPSLAARTAQPSRVQTDDEGRLVRPDPHRDTAADTVPARDQSPATRPDLPTSVWPMEERMSQIFHLLDQARPARYSGTLNFRHLDVFTAAEGHRGSTWPRQRLQEAEPEDIHPHGLQDVPTARRESLASVLLEELEDARSVVGVGRDTERAREPLSKDPRPQSTAQRNRRPECLALPSPGLETAMSAQCPGSTLTSPVSLLPANTSPDDERHEKLQEDVRKGDFEEIQSMVSDLPQADGRNLDYEMTDSQDIQDDESETHTDIPICSDLPETIPTVDLHSSADMQEPPSSEACPTGFSEPWVWEAVENARKDIDLQDLYQFASAHLADPQEMRNILRKTVIPEARARKDIDHLLNNLTLMTSRFQEMCQKRQDTACLRDPQKDDSESAPEASSSSLPADASSPTCVLSRVSSLLAQVEDVCRQMMVFTRVYIFCGMCLHTSRKLTTERSRTKTLGVVPHVIMLSEWTSLQGWGMLTSGEELMLQLPQEGEVLDRVGEIVALMKTFLENA